MFKKILIANRGEIAMRIIRAAREMNIESVAIYHDIDKEAPFVQYADYAYKISGNTPKAAYLDIPQIIEVALRSNSEAIHPGYGFLSENSVFSSEVSKAGLVFIGPDANSIELMGNKTRARQLMTAAGVPIVPGTKEQIESDEELIKTAEEIGYPILLKAAAGGGGKGMRKVDSVDELIESYRGAKREAANAFGDDAIYIEKYIINPKHIEIQIIADAHNNYVHLGERDCSIQRRHQKVIEESAKACNYVNAGTVEFLVDKNKNFYFLEMNTRLQVEHPVTEMATGIDLVKEQFKIAFGMPLSFKQEDVRFTNHAIECRIYAEDPFNNFLPDTGKITHLRRPCGNGVRVDSGIDEGSEVTIHFDPMLSKLIVWGRDRNEALGRMESALRNYRIQGVRTIIPFLIAVMQHPEFRYGYFDTGFIQHTFDMDVLDKIKEEQEEIIAAIAAFGFRMTRKDQSPVSEKQKISKWKENNLLMRRLL
jgi:acetyl-CoA carboxylase biotin carboxylase subunit